MKPITACLYLILLTGAAKAADNPDFRGIKLGSKMTQAQIMHALGADKFKVDPEINNSTSARTARTRGKVSSTA